MDKETFCKISDFFDGIGYSIRKIGESETGTLSVSVEKKDRAARRAEYDGSEAFASCRAMA